MTFEERIEKLIERHEALVQYLELSSHDWNQRYGTLSQATDKHGKQIDELSMLVRRTVDSVDTLARIVALHEHRLDSLEG
jgi:hypothetical protein